MLDTYFKIKKICQEAEKRWYKNLISFNVFFLICLLLCLISFSRIVQVLVSCHYWYNCKKYLFWKVNVLNKNGSLFKNLIKGIIIWELTRCIAAPLLKMNSSTSFQSKAQVFFLDCDYIFIVFIIFVLFLEFLNS